MSDQTSHELTKIFLLNLYILALVSKIFWKLIAFYIAKSYATSYHPQGDRMVDIFNRSLLQPLQAY